MNRTIYFGPPGTGKTHTLLARLEESLRAKVPADRIAFLTFTRRARHEAVTRVEQTMGIGAKDLPFFRTIHSMAFRALKLQDGDVMGRRQLNDFGETMGLVFGEVAASEQAAEGLGSQSKGDHILAIDNLARLRGTTAQAVWRDARSPYDWPTVDQFVRSYQTYKRDKGLLDFTDVLSEFTAARIQLPVDVSFIDEAQDLSALQWFAALQAVENAREQYVAGDDDQAIYRWAGAEVELFQNLPGNREVLHQSYRLPRAVHAPACAILRRIKSRIDKIFNPRDADGSLWRHARAESLTVSPGDSWLWLVRNRYLLQPLRERLEADGVVYTHHGASSVIESERDAIYSWERLRAGKAISAASARDVYKRLKSRVQIKHGVKLLPGVDDDEQLTLADLRDTHGLLVEGPWFEIFIGIPVERRGYYRKLLRAHATLKLAPQVVLDTIHGSKGAESNKVALFLEQSKRTSDEAAKTPDEEHRVWYVGATRARDELHLIDAPSRYSYPFPRVSG